MMVILGLGSNIGDRLDHLRKAVKAIRQMEGLRVECISPLYLSDALLPDNAPTEWDAPYLNCAIRVETSIDAHALLDLLKQIEWSIGRKPELRHWGPRILDIDILAYGEIIIQTERLSVPHDSLLERPFALWPLADVAPKWRYPIKGNDFGKTANELVERFGSRFTGKAPLHTWQIGQRLEGPQLVGIINITPDSFSDGDRYEDVDQALQHTIDLIECGAEVLDIGAESTAPHAEPLDPETEWQRLKPILQTVQSAKSKFILPPKISIDTRHARVLEQALAFDIDWLNDVSGLTDKTMQEVVIGCHVQVVLMHHLTIPASKQHTLSEACDPMAEVLHFAKTQIRTLEQIGVDPKRLIIDPGIGFGKTPLQSLQLLRDIDRLGELDRPILVGHSRKSFYSLFTAYPAYERDLESAVTSYYLAGLGVDYLRVHDVESSARALKLQAGLQMRR